MAFAGVLVGDVINDAIAKLAQVPGYATQLYAQPALLSFFEQAFDFCFQENWWNVYTSYVTMTLDGVTGRLIAQVAPFVAASGNITLPSNTPSGVNPLTRYNNIRNCFPENSNRIIRELPPRTNPSVLTGTAPMYKSADRVNPNSPIIFYPFNSSGNVVLEVRDEPQKPFQITDTVLLDKQLLSLGTCFFYLLSDGDSAAAADGFQRQFQARLQQMMGADSDTTLQLDPRFTAEQDQWWELG